jgi:putative spermidine/putrescine transport system substrate-binding protein
MSDAPQSTAKRSSLKILASGALSVAAVCQAPYVFAKTRTKLRILGTHVTLQEELRQKATEDLGIDLEFEAKGSAAVLQKASVNPASFDLYEQWSNSIRPLWTSGSLQAI